MVPTFFLQAMNEASKRLIGEHDFRNFCKINVKEIKSNYVRSIISAEVKALEESDTGFTMCEFTVTANAFLWHQIRCIVSVLFLVGRGKEDAQVIDDLFDVEKIKGRPQSNISSGKP